VPPDVTVGAVVVVVGAVAGVDEPDDRVLEDPVLEEDAGDVVVVEAGVEADAVALPRDDVLLAPGCSFATTTPMSAAAPVAAITTERVTRRRRTWARDRASREDCSRVRCMVVGLRCRERSHTNITGSARAQSPL
jgi:hypothetical protein